MINIKLLEKEDIDNILEIAKEIKKAATSIRVEDIKCKLNIGFERLYESADEAWGDTNCLLIALYFLFGNDYNAKRLARNSYVYDEGEHFTETVDTDSILGYVRLPNGALIQSSTFEVECRVRQYGTRNKYTGLPFDIVRMSIISPHA